MSNELAITPVLLVGHGVDRKLENLSSLAQESLKDERNGGQSGIAIEAEAATLSNPKLVILGTAMFMLWACNAGGILTTAFALPVMAKEFNVSPAEVQWVAASCMIVWGCFRVIAGRLCDIFGRKRGLLVGASIWIISNALTTFMPNLPALNVCRALSGLGAATLLPASSGIVGAMYPAGKKRTLAFVAISAGGAGGSAASELVAGLFLEYNRWTWRPCYLINAIASIYCPVIVIWLVPNDVPHARSKKMDWIGSALLGTSLFLLLFCFTAAQTADKGWKAPYVPALLAMFAVLLACFVLRQRQLLLAANTGQDRPPPLIPASLLTKKCWNLLIIYIASFCSWAGIDSIVTPIAYLYMDVLNMSKFEAGLRISLCFFSGLWAALLVAITINRVPPLALITACCIVTTLSPILFAIRELDWPYWRADMWAFLVLGFATDSTVAAGLTIISTTAPIEDGSVASPLFQTSCRLGYPFGLAISTLVGSSVEKKSIGKGAQPLSALVDGLRASFRVIAGFVLIGALVVGFGMQGWTMLDGETEFRNWHAPVEAINEDTRETTPTLGIEASDSKV